jgi:hypothetical protein
VLLDTVPGTRADRVAADAGALAHPPPGLLASLAWSTGGDTAAAVRAWHGPAAADAGAPVPPRHTWIAGDAEVAWFGDGTRRGGDAPFLDTVTGLAAEEDQVLALNGMLRTPPPGLLCYLSWEVGPGRSSTVIGWVSAGARGDWAQQVMMPLSEAGRMAGVTGRLEHPKPITVWIHPGRER